MSKFIVGIDVGGTNVKAGLVEKSGKIIARTSLNTKAFNQNKNQLILAMVGMIKDFLIDHHLKSSQIVGIGIGLPGLIDPPRGVVRFLPNIPGWENVRLAEIFKKKLGIPAFLENDVHLITLGEWKFGAGRGATDMICMTLGTGVGSGLILNNQVYRGPAYVAGELGHMPLNEEGPDCACGGYGCFERYVGNQALLEKAKAQFQDANITLEDMTALAREKNPQALKFWEEVGQQVGNGLVGVVNLLNPKLIVIGGGVANANFPFLSKSILQTIHRRAMKVQGAMVKIKRAQLGNDAGLQGAWVLVKSQGR
ncbi:MAG: ROK family protein [Candidatus Omnitrophica bacterium]|nr:ROK family protein [Candidatus Omnitrophota bacterium]